MDLNSLTLFDCLLLNFILLILALFGIFLNRRNLIILFLCLEVIFLILSLNFFYIAFFFNNYLGYIYGFIIIILAASESVVGISLLVLLFRVSGRISYDSLTILRG
jgi:NADH-quinone oxidoreductase subunit K